MTPREYARLRAFAQAASLDRLHKRNISSKRSAKGRANHVGVALKNSRIYMLSPERIFSAATKYRSLNPDSNLCHQAS